MGIVLALYFLWSVSTYLSLYEALDIDKDKVKLSLLLVIAVTLNSPLVYVLSFLDLRKGNLVRQAVFLSIKIVVLNIILRRTT